MTDVDPQELGDVVTIFACPECGRDLRLEFRENAHHEFVHAICPDECFATSLRAGVHLEHKSMADTRPPAGYCVQCQEQIVDEEDAEPVTLAGNDHVVHSDCEQAFHDEHTRMGGERA